MIHIESNNMNTLTFVETTPANFSLHLEHIQTKYTASIDCVNDLVTNTQTSIFIESLPAGEYKYKLQTTNNDLVTVYESGIAKVPTMTMPEIKTYNTTKKYKTYVR